MSLQHLLEEQIDILFEKDKDLKDYSGDRYEKAVPIFCNLKYLNGLENEELMSGVLGSGGDEGIDVSYIFHNSELITNIDTELEIKKDHTIRFVFFQIKKETSFKTNGFKLFKEGVEKVFDLDTPISSIKDEGANKEYISLCENIRSIWKQARLNSAAILVDIFYVTQAPNTKLASAIPVQLEKLKRKLESSNIKFNSNFLNARDILNLVQKTDDRIGIVFQNPPLNIKDKSIATSGYAGIINGNTLLSSFSENENIEENSEIEDKDKVLKFKSYLTEGNVRYFLGEKTPINKGIIDSAKDENNAEIFWAMNNGLTIICEKITDISSTEFELLNPSIVNGCQTIHCLYQARDELKGLLPKKLGVFCKIIQTEIFEIQSKIIYSTNSQNEVKRASLKANDTIQKSIEEYLLPFEIYYERRENYYKRKNYTGNKVISLTRMAQILHSIINKESIIAINDIKTCFESSSQYQSIFDETADFSIYRFSTFLYLKTLSLKNSDLRSTLYNSEDKSLISKSTFVILHIISSLILAESSFDSETQKYSYFTKRIKINEKRNEFNIRQEKCFSILEDNEKMKELYTDAVKILFMSVDFYMASSGKEKLSFLKQRKFDHDFLIPNIDKFLKNKTILQAELV